MPGDAKARRELPEQAQGLRLPGDVVRVEKHLLARLLYANPVCLLSTKATLMTISWLTAINNEGGFVLSMNKGRHSATAVEEVGDRFVLSVPTAGMEEQATRVGGCSGRDTNKWVEMGLARCVPGWIMEQGCGDDGSDNGQKRRKVEDSSSSSSSSSSSWAKNDPVSLDGGNRFSGGAPKPKKKQKHRKERWFEPRERRMRSSGDVAVGNEGVCAHMVCDVVQNLELSEERNHKVLHCQILLGYVKRTYWSGTTFRSEDEQLYPPYLSFLGSKTFARTAHTHASSGEAAEQKVTQDDATP